MGSQKTSQHNINIYQHDVNQEWHNGSLNRMIPQWHQNDTPVFVQVQLVSESFVDWDQANGRRDLQLVGERGGAERLALFSRDQSCRDLGFFGFPEKNNIGNDGVSWMDGWIYRYRYNFSKMWFCYVLLKLIIPYLGINIDLSAAWRFTSYQTTHILNYELFYELYKFTWIII